MKLLLSSKEGSFSDNIYPRNTNVLGSKFTNCVTRLATLMMTVYLGRDRPHCAAPDCNSCDSVGTDKENTRTWP